MKYKCYRCELSIVELDFEQAFIPKLYELIQENRLVEANKLLNESLGYDEEETRSILLHWNVEKDCCQLCKCAGLRGENALCPKCKSFNYNYGKK